jgi:hypothetical protein
MLIEGAWKDFRESHGLPEAFEVGEDYLDVATEFPEELAACAAG